LPGRIDLARRNQALAARIHARTTRQRARSVLLQMIAHLPFPTAADDDQTILLIRPDHLGDVLLTTPAIQALARAVPHARLVALVGPWSAEVISAYPEIDLTLTLPFPGFTRTSRTASPRPYWQAWRWAQKLRHLKAKSAIIFRPDHWWGAMLAAMAGIPQRIGFDLPDVAPFLSQAIPFKKGHAVELGMSLVSPWVETPPREAIRLHFPVVEEDRQYIQERLREWNFPDGAPRVIIHPGAGSPIKQWSPAYWAHVADRLVGEWGAPIIFTGSDRELRTIRNITHRMAAPAIILAGETSVSQLAALYDGARVVIGPDSGPLHLAVAAGTPTVHLYGPADPAEFGPWGSPERHAVLTSDIACRPCRVLDWNSDDPANHPCVRDIAPDDVIAAALHVTQQNSQHDDTMTGQTT